jgi:membrane-associated phospholipid phosphatase
VSTTDTARAVESRTARVLSEVFAPWVIVIALSGAVAWRATEALVPTVAWGLLIATTSSVLPMGVIVWGARRGRWDGHHVRDREGRLVPFLALLVLSGACLGLLLWWEAPRMLVALDVAMIAVLLVSGAITVWWKVSMHAAVAAGAVVILAVAYTAWLLPLLLVVGAVCWSRVRLGDHTTAQVVAGTVLGVVVGGGVFALAL